MDIGEIKRVYEIEPLEEPGRTPVEPIPDPIPVQEPEKVPA